MSHITHKRIIAAAAVPAVAAATLIGAASSASAAIGPRAYTTDSAGYGMAHAQFGTVQFRYVRDTVYLRPRPGSRPSMTQSAGRPTWPARTPKASRWRSMSTSAAIRRPRAGTTPGPTSTAGP